MSVVHLPDAARVSVAEAKWLLSESFPREDVMDVYVNNAGEYHCEFKADGNPQAFYLEHDFADTCEQLGIKPRFKLRPLLTGYRGPQDDELYVITRDELAALAVFFGIDVAIQEPVPALEQVTQAADVTQAASAKCEPVLGSGAMREVFGHLPNLPKQAFSDVPRWLDEPHILVARREAPNENEWNPVAFAKCMMERKRATDEVMNRLFLNAPRLKPFRPAWQEARREANAFGS